MQFSGSTTKNDLISDITWLLGQDENAFKREDRTRCINERYRLIWTMIFQSYGGWKFMDDNISDTTTGLPYTDQTLTSGTALYSLPSESMSINSISVIGQGGSRQLSLKGISYEEYERMGGDAFNNSSAMPRYYIPQGDTIRLIPTPNYTVSNGLRIYFDQGISSFLPTDTTKVPGFNENFHRMLSIGAALDYAMARELKDKVAYLSNLWNDYEFRLKRFYASRWRNRRPANLGGGLDLTKEFS